MFDQQLFSCESINSITEDTEQEKINNSFKNKKMKTKIKTKILRQWKVILLFIIISSIAIFCYFYYFNNSKISKLTRNLNKINIQKIEYLELKKKSQINLKEANSKISSLNSEAKKVLSDINTEVK